MVTNPEDWPYSSHRAYIGVEKSRVVDSEPVLRHFGATKRLAIQRYTQFVHCGLNDGHRSELYQPVRESILGADEFLETIEHRIGRTTHSKPSDKVPSEDVFLAAVSKVAGMDRTEFCGAGKSRTVVTVKEAMVFAGRRAGFSNSHLARLTGLDDSSVSRRWDSARRKIGTSRELKHLTDKISRELARLHKQ
jgi:hypothetical protein